MEMFSRMYGNSKGNIISLREILTKPDGLNLRKYTGNK